MVTITIISQIIFSIASASLPSSTPNTQSVLPMWCSVVDREIKKLNWRLPACVPDDFVLGGLSVQGRKLVYASFGNPNAADTTLIFSMVHSDEITPMYVGLRLISWLKQNPEILKDRRVVVAPLVNPDGFFRAKRTRVNANGVDLNRNFATEDWTTSALKEWKKSFHSDPRRFPGNKPDSEPETNFQKQLLVQFKPTKIISIHAPLNYLDYDGPNTLELATFSKEYVEKCLELRSKLNAKSSGFFPGSLGNYAGQERGIPTFTLELPTAKAELAENYWYQFKSGIKTVIEFDVPIGGQARAGFKLE